MSNQIDSPKAPRLANLRRFAGEFHSVAKQTLFCIAFRVDFRGQNAPKIVEISSFGAVCFTSSFRAANLMISGGPQGWKTLILPSKNKVFHEIHFPRTGTIFGRFSSPKLGRNPLNLGSQGCCFFDFIFEANFIDFGVPFGGQKTIEFRENYDFWTTLVGTLLWYCHWLRFRSNFEVPGGQISWILAPEACEIREFPGEFGR